MTLTRDRLIGYEFDRMDMLFSMVDGEREYLARSRRLHDRIEERAARKFAALEFNGNPRGIILRSTDFQTSS